MTDDPNQQRGLFSGLAMVCSNCKRSTPLPTSLPRPGVGVSYDVNRLAAYAMGEIGGGRSLMENICSIFNMPPPPNKTSWSQHNTAIYTVLNEELDIELANSGYRLREKLLNENDDLDPEDTLDAVVSYDGTWHRRGFTSNYGVGVIIAMDTGEVLDVQVVSKLCEECKAWEWMDPNCEPFMAWKREHEASGQCQANYAGSSPAMEVEAAKIMFKRSEEKHRLRYSTIVSDGDSKTFLALNELQPYGPGIELKKI